MKKRLLTIEDLYNYYSSTSNSCHFSAKDEKENIVVQVNGKLKFEESGDNIEGLLPVYLQANHTERNINGSSISEEVATAALPSFSNRPILGYIHEVDGEPNFYGHNMHQNDSGEVVYDEKPIGIIPESCEAHLEYDKDKDKTYVCVKGYIFEEYSKAAEILKRESECPVSVELSIRELSYNAKEKYLDIESYYYSGVTILGKDEDGNDVNPGMVGSNIKIGDFSADNNSVCDNDKIFNMLAELNEKISNFTIDKIQEGGNQVGKFDELLEKYGKTAEDIDFDYENMTDEELEAKFAELFEESEEASDVQEESNGDVDDSEEPSEEENCDSEEEVSEEEANSEEKFTKTFEISHEDVRVALYNLLAPYESEDNDYYAITSVFDDHFVYEGWFTGNIFGQKYVKDGDNVSFDGERYNLYAEYVTDSEKVTLDEMRANYSAMKEKLDKFENEPKKMEILESKDYAQISDLDEFKALKEKDAHFDMSIEEVTNKCNEMLLAYAKTGKLDFSSIEEKTKIAKKSLPQMNKKQSRYGNLFAK